MPPPPPATLAIIRPPPTWEILQFRIVTSVTRQSRHRLLAFLGVRRIENPDCEKPPQLFSRTLSSNNTRCAFFSSKLFLTINGCALGPPMNPGAPDIQRAGLNK